MHRWSSADDKGTAVNKRDQNGHVNFERIFSSGRMAEMPRLYCSIKAVNPLTRAKNSKAFKQSRVVRDAHESALGHWNQFNGP
jgi:hypothetical protein